MALLDVSYTSLIESDMLKCYEESLVQTAVGSFDGAVSKDTKIAKCGLGLSPVTQVPADEKSTDSISTLPFITASMCIKHFLTMLDIFNPAHNTKYTPFAH